MCDTTTEAKSSAGKGVARRDSYPFYPAECLIFEPAAHGSARWAGLRLPDSQGFPWAYHSLWYLSGAGSLNRAAPYLRTRRAGGSCMPVPTTLHSVGVSRAWEGHNPSSLTAGADEIIVSPSSRRQAFPHRLSTALVVAYPTDQCSSCHGSLSHIESSAGRETAPELVAPRLPPMLCRTVISTSVPVLQRHAQPIASASNCWKNWNLMGLLGSLRTPLTS